MEVNKYEDCPFIEEIESADNTNALRLGELMEDIRRAYFPALEPTEKEKYITYDRLRSSILTPYFVDESKELEQTRRSSTRLDGKCFRLTRELGSDEELMRLNLVVSKLESNDEHC